MVNLLFVYGGTAGDPRSLRHRRSPVVGGVLCVFGSVNHPSLEETRSTEAAQAQQEAGTPLAGFTPWAHVKTPRHPGHPPTHTHLPLHDGHHVRQATDHLATICNTKATWLRTPSVGLFLGVGAPRGQGGSGVGVLSDKAHS